jgi:CRISPR-associated protein Cas5d
MSYPVMTPSAARGLLEAVMWKPAIQWQVERIQVLREIRFTSFRRNEVSTRASAPTARIVQGGGTILPYFADDDRAQRNTVALRDVDYVVEAHFTMTGKAGPLDNVTKFCEIFERRVAKGQHFHQPCFGCRELDAEILPPEGAPPPIEDSRDLGLMLWDVDYTSKPKKPIFFAARLEHGVLVVPEDPEATLAALAVGGVA